MWKSCREKNANNFIVVMRSWRPERERENGISKRDNERTFGRICTL
jgi:hypothetical protein